MKRLTRIALATLSAATALAPAHALVIGTADTSNSIPFGGNTGGYYYQQVYDGTAFGGAIDISSLTFYTSLSPSSAARGGTFVVYLSTIASNTDIAAFDTNVSQAWLDGSFVEVFNSALPSLVDNKLVLTLSQNFAYDPGAGDLLLTVREFGLANGATYFDVTTGASVTNSRFSAYPYNWNQGLVTGFNETTGAVPEPATWAMMIAGFGIVGLAMRRRRTTIAFA